MENDRMTHSEPRVIVTGTGRAGTTLLMQILTDLGLDTGFTSSTPIDQHASAGLERSILSDCKPRIVKDPTLSANLRSLLITQQVVIEHVIVPIRDLEVAAASRVRVTGYGKDPFRAGGLFGTRSGTQQTQALANLFYTLFDTISEHDLPHTLLRFPRFANDADYTYEKLSFLDPSIPRERWHEVIQARTDLRLIHQTPLSRDEQRRALVGTVYTNYVRRAAGRIQRMLRRSRDT